MLTIPKRPRLDVRTSIRLTEEEDAYIREVAKKNKARASEVLRTFLQAGMNEWKRRDIEVRGGRPHLKEL